MKVFFTQILGGIMLGYAGIIFIAIDPAIGELDRVKTMSADECGFKRLSKLDIDVDKLQ